MEILSQVLFDLVSKYRQQNGCFTFFVRTLLTNTSPTIGAVITDTSYITPLMYEDSAFWQPNLSRINLLQHKDNFYCDVKIIKIRFC